MSLQPKPVSPETGRLPKTGPRRATPLVNKCTQPSGTQKGLRSQNKLSVSQAGQPFSTSSSPTPPAPDLQPASVKRKRSRDLEAEADKPKEDYPSKQPRRSSRRRPAPSGESRPKDVEAGARADKLSDHPEQTFEPPLLSEKDSRLLQSIFEEVMASAASSSLKRTTSHRSRVPSESSTGATNTNAVYRRKNLVAVNIRFHAEPPDDVEATIKGIVNANPTQQRTAELRDIAKAFRDGCLQNVRAQSGEDDFLAPLHTSIMALCFDNLRIRQKVAWRGELKPAIGQRPRFSSSFMAGTQQPESDSAPGPPPKRQRSYANENCISPESSRFNRSTPPADCPSDSSAMPPPPLPVPEQVKDRSPIKTPRPDLSMGINLEAIVSALSSEGLAGYEATLFVEWLQHEMVQHEPDRPLEPMLLLVPAPLACDLAFPFVVVEGKAYSTGKQIFEAENQAAVAMACAHKLLHCLDHMANHETTTTAQPRVLFSITTQGPIHELWAHWTVVKDGVRVFESKLWDSWNGLVLERAEDFMVKLDSVCLWGTGPFLRTVVEPLGIVARKARPCS